MKAESIQLFKDTEVLIVGDIMLDTYYRGHVNRMSPEAPVPVLSVDKIERRLGGAGNVAANIQALKAKAFMATIIGEDSTGNYIMDLLLKNKINTDCVLRSNKRLSTEKIRIINRTEHIVRCDLENEMDIDQEEEVQFLSSIKKCIEQHHIKVIILQDYNKGILTETLIRSIIEIANAYNIPVAVDPKKKNFFAYKNVQLFKPNLKEVKEALGIDIDPLNMASLIHAATIIIQKLNCKNILITLSENGAFYLTNEGEANQIAAHDRNIIDVSGAGDTVISTAALCMAHDFSMADTTYISNLAGGLVCEESGVVSIHLERLAAFV